MEKHPLSARPFAKIVTSMSDNGYRASAFHLGTLSYLNRLRYEDRPLLDNLKMISTVSGDSIAGIIYTIKKQQGYSFEKCYEFLLNQLKEINLIKECIEKLNPKAHWHPPTKNKTETLPSLQAGTELDTFVFNSTDLKNAIDFRFKDCRSGLSSNFPRQIDSDVAGEIKLSEIMACSSCFPSRFEQMIWPYDYLHEKAPKIKSLCDAVPVPIGIMDGGIYDNQGIDSPLNYKTVGRMLTLIL